MGLSKLTDEQLYKYCKELGTFTLEYRKRFIGTLPEVYKRKLYRKYKIASIYEFANRLAGINNEVVKRVLRLDIKLKDRPALRQKLRDGLIGWSKIEIAEKIATSATDKEFADKLETLSTDALKVLVKDQRSKSDFDIEVVKFLKVSFKLSPENLHQLKKLKAQYKTLTWNETISELIKQCNTNTSNTKVKAKTRKSSNKPKLNVQTRYIPVEQKQQALNSTNHKCSHSNCNKIANQLHHKDAYAISKSHDSIIPLCKEHHELVHHFEHNPINSYYIKYKKAAIKRN
jgi:hypothetical protein